MKRERKEIREEKGEEEEIYHDYFYYSNRNVGDFYDNEFEYDISSETVKGEKNNSHLEENIVALEREKTGLTPEIKEELNNGFNPKNDNIIIHEPIFEKQKNGNNVENDNILEKENLSMTKNKKALGRKRKNSEEKGIHNKYCEDNILRKIKSTILLHLLEFLNSVIYNIYNGKIGKGLFKKELKKLNQSQIVDMKSNQLFLNKTLKEIFSDEISTKYSNFPGNQNKKIIEGLLNEKDLEKRNKFQSLFSLTFLDCLEHFRGTKTITDLEGFEKYDNHEEKFWDDKEYLRLFKYYISNFENIIRKKKHRNKRK